MIPINIEDLIKKRVVESTRIEYKENFIPNKVLHTICAYANDIENIGGGYILVGINEENGMPSPNIKGIDKNEIDKIKQKTIEICNYIEPRIFPHIDDFVYKNKNIIVIYVPGGVSRPYKATKDIEKDISNKRFYIRKGSSTIEANINEEKNLYDISTNIPFDDRECLRANVNDIDIGLVRNHLKEINSTKLEMLKNMSDIDILEDLHLVSGKNENCRPLNVAILMFCEEPQKYFPHAYIDVVDIPNPNGENISEKRFSGPIQRQLRDALQYLKNYIIETKTIKLKNDFEAKIIYSYPLVAIDEILSNAVYHKSYEIDEPITVRINNDSIEIISLPGFASSITQKDIDEKKIRGIRNRNRRIGDFLKELKLIEGRNTGFPSVYESLNKNGSDDIIINMDSDRNYVVVKIPKHIDFIDKSTKLKLLDEKKILAILANGSLSKVQLAKELGYKGITKKLTETIRVLEKQGKINQYYGNGRESRLSISSIKISEGEVVSTINEDRDLVEKVEKFLKAPIPTDKKEIMEYISSINKLFDEIRKKGMGQQMKDMQEEYINTGLINYIPNNRILINPIYNELMFKLNEREKDVLSNIIYME